MSCQYLDWDTLAVSNQEAAAKTLPFPFEGAAAFEFAGTLSPALASLGPLFVTSRS